MFTNRSFTEVLAASTVFFCIWVPAIMWIIFSIHEKKLAEFPGSLTGFMAAANTVTLGLLGLQLFTNKTTTSGTPTA